MNNAQKKTNLFIVYSRRRAVWYLGALAIATGIALPRAQASSSLRGGVSGGYSHIATSRENNNASANGGSLGLHLQYHFNDTWGIQIEGTWHRFADMKIPRQPSGYIPPSITDLTMLAGSAGVVYLVDVMRATPYLYAGLGPLYFTHTQGGSTQSFVELSFRFDIGVDIRTLHWLDAGIILRIDTPLTSSSPYDAHLGVLLRLTAVWKRQEFEDETQER